MVFLKIKIFELKKLLIKLILIIKKLKIYFFKSGRWDIETNSEILIKLPKEFKKIS